MFCALPCPFPGGEQFYQFAEAELLRTCDGLLASEYIFEADWPNWEMHPDCDEFIYLRSGDVQLHIEHQNGIGLVMLDDCRAVIVPRGVWHTAKIKAPNSMLHVNRDTVTQTCAVQH